MKQSDSIEIAYLISGEVDSVRRLSRRGELRSGLAAFGLVVCLAVVSATVVALALLVAHRVLFLPTYFGLWGAVGLVAALLAALRAVRRARIYSVGASIDDDAFSALALPLVRRTSAGYRLAVIPGFTGRIDGGRAPLAIEALVREGGGKTVDLPLEAGMRAEVTVGPATFVVRAFASGPSPALPAGLVRRFARRALFPLELAALGSIFCAVPVGAQISDRDMRSSIPKTATPLEVEKALRAEAQTQARSLHQCFDVLPISCQHSGYVAVGVELSREGEMREHWIAHSTYDAQCPVEQCMSDVVSTWFFDEIPESMRLVLPVQVLRTDKPLPYGHERATADLERTATRKQLGSGVN